MQTVELIFQVSSSNPVMIPIDHSHALYGAVKNAVPELALCENLGIHALRGKVFGKDLIMLDRRKAKLRLRLPIEFVPKALRLAGHVLRVHNSRISIGVCTIAPLNSAKTLWARMVTRKFENHDNKIAENSLQNALQDAYPTAKFKIKRARTINIHQKQILGFEVLAENLSPDDSLKLQSLGFGGRRAFGCGIFVTVGAKHGT
jgi:CRISPR-associated protein Cas6